MVRFNLDEKQLNELLHEPAEKDWFDFKGKLKLYQADGKLVERQRDELLKDILGLANGNSHIIRKTKYLIVGADDKKFDGNGRRVLHHVDYKVPSQSDIAKWLSSASSPQIVGIECELISFQGVNLFVITIPPTFDLHETIRELVTSDGHFTEYTVFMRQDEHTHPASVRDGMTIQQLKHLYRQEVTNPSAIWIGAIAGGIVAVLTLEATMRGIRSTPPLPESLIRIILPVFGIYIGTATAWTIKVWNETRYDWRYMTRRQRILAILLIVILVITSVIIFR